MQSRTVKRVINSGSSRRIKNDAGANQRVGGPARTAGGLRCCVGCDLGK